MAFRFLLLHKRLIILPVSAVLPGVCAFCIVACIMASFFYEKFSSIQIGLLAREAV